MLNYHAPCVQALELRMQALLAAGRRVILLGDPLPHSFQRH